MLSYGILARLAGRTGTRVVSAFVKFLAAVFQCEIDVQVGNGRLNYINGYVSKDHDVVDVGLGEYTQKDATAPWLAAYRLLSKVRLVFQRLPFASRTSRSGSGRIRMCCCILRSQPRC